MSLTEMRPTTFGKISNDSSFRSESGEDHPLNGQVEIGDKSKDFSNMERRVAALVNNRGTSKKSNGCQSCGLCCAYWYFFISLTAVLVLTILAIILFTSRVGVEGVPEEYSNDSGIACLIAMAAYVILGAVLKCCVLDKQPKIIDNHQDTEMNSKVSLE